MRMRKLSDTRNHSIPDHSDRDEASRRKERVIYLRMNTRVVLLRALEESFLMAHT